MKRSKDELQEEFLKNQKVLDKVKKEIVKLLKNADKENLFGSSDLSKALALFEGHKKVIEEQRELASELKWLVESKGEYRVQDLFEDVKNGNCVNLACAYLDGKDLSLKDKDGWTALHIAALNGLASTVSCLLKMGADVDIKNGNKQTPLHIAVSHDRLAVVEILLQNGANPFIRDGDRRCPMHMTLSVEMGNVIKSFENKFLAASLDNPKLFMAECKTPALCAVEEKNHTMLKLLLPLHEKGLDVGMQTVDDRGNTLLHVVMINDDLESLDLLLSVHPFPFRKNKNGKYPVEIIGPGKLKKRMAEYEANYIGEMAGNVEAMRHLGGELLLYCVEKGYLKAVEDMMPFINNRLIDIDVNDAHENTPLHLTAKYGWVEIAVLLLQNGADMMVMNKDELMPADFIGDNKKMMRIFNNYERLWVSRILQRYHY